jgi:anti-anti-sigma factor
MSNTAPGSVLSQVDCFRGIPVMVITGRLDTISAPLFDEKASPVLAEAHGNILLDFSGLTYLSSAGLRSILRIIKHTAACGGRTGIIAVPSHILELIELSGFQSLLDIYADRETALEGCAA